VKLGESLGKDGSFGVGAGSPKELGRVQEMKEGGGSHDPDLGVRVIEGSRDGENDGDDKENVAKNDDEKGAGGQRAR
jgi:hypothetical protein